MAESSTPYITNRRYLKIQSSAVGRDDLKKLFELMKEKTKEAADLEIQQLTKRSNTSDEDFQELKRQVKDSVRLYVDIIGMKGEHITSSTEKIFEPTVMPDHIYTISYDSATYHRLVWDRNPQNHVTLLFDFGKPSLLEFSDPSYEPTPNKSFLEVAGTNDTWVNGVYEKLQLLVKSKRTKRAWLHTHYLYQLLFFFFVLPIAFWIVYRIDYIFSSRTTNWPGALKAAFYVYIVLLVIQVFRLLFLYTRWVFPLFEYIDQMGDSSKRQRYYLGAIAFTLVTALIYDILKTLIQ